MRSLKRLWAGWLASSLVVGSALTLAAGCGGKSEGDGKQASALSPCEAELAELCQTPCDAATACPGGLYCSQGMCRADCTPEGNQCSGGTCTPDGHCGMNDGPDLLGPGGGGGLGPAGSGGANFSGEGCIQQGVEFESLTPTVELLVDRSGSMDANFGQQDRWNTIRDILVDPMDGFIAKLQDKVRFGLTLYTGFSADPENGVAASCADLIDVPIALTNYQQIHDVFMANEIGDDTPTAESMVAVTTKLEAYQEIGPKIIVLATDGDPDTCLEPDANGTDPPRALVEAAAQAAYDKNIQTFVIAVGDEFEDLAHLTRVAQIGRGGDPNADYYPAEDANSLVNAFAQILGIVVSCDFDLNGTVAEQFQSQGIVSIDGNRLTFGDPNGWEMVDEDTVRLNGSACSTIQLGASEVLIQFPCGTIDIR